MNRIKILGLCLMAMFAMSVMVSASASALPSFYHCVKKTGGKWKTGCEKEETNGGFEKEPLGAGVHVKFTSKSGSGTLKTKNHTIECSADTDVGETNGPGAVANVKVKFTGCKVFGFLGCETPGAGSEVIVTNLLKGVLGYLSKSPLKVGLLLEPSSGTLFTTIECVGITGEVKGGIIGEITPVNSMKITGTLSYKEVSGGQEFTKFEGETPTHELEVFGEKGVLVTSDTNTFTEAIEVRA